MKVAKIINEESDIKNKKPDIRIEMFKLDANGEKMVDKKTKKPKHYKF